MKKLEKIDLGLKEAYDELFMTDEERKENRLPRIYDIPLSQIDDFPDHPFKVKIDEDMEQLVESIKQRGIITPITLREKEDGRYEIVSGHRRKKACEIAGLETIKAEIKELDRDEAIILMVESNLQRSTILPSISMGSKTATGVRTPVLPKVHSMVFNVVSLFRTPLCARAKGSPLVFPKNG